MAMLTPLSVFPETRSRFSVRLLILICFSFFTAVLPIRAAESTTFTSRVNWQYGGHQFSTDLQFNSADYYYYKGFSKTWPKAQYATEDETHPYLVSLAAQLDADADKLGLTGYRLVEYLTAFVQEGIPYKKDPYNNGYDYPKYPIETIVERSGDCEDKAALLVALLNTFGYDAVMVRLPGHMVAAVSTNGIGSYYSYRNKKYSFIETTSDWKIGSVPSKYRKALAAILDVERPEKYVRGQAGDLLQKQISKNRNQSVGCAYRSDLKFKSAVLKSKKRNEDGLMNADSDF